MSTYRIEAYIDSDGNIHGKAPDDLRNRAVVINLEPVPTGSTPLPATATVGDLLKFWGTMDDPTMQVPEDLPPEERDFQW